MSNPTNGHLDPFGDGTPTSWVPGDTPAILPASIPVCYLTGTQILTGAGEVAVEDLRIGDLVHTLSGALRPITWIGSGQALVTPITRDRCAPILVRRDALADGVPVRDLYITRGHSLFLDGHLVPVEEVLNYRSITPVNDEQAIEFYHIELETHDVLFADGAPCETYREDENALRFANSHTRPDRPSVPAFAPFMRSGADLVRLWQRLADRAGGEAVRITRDADLHLMVDGARVDASGVFGKIARFRMPRGAREANLVSRSAIPSELALGQDQRRLGVAVRSVRRLGAEAMSVSWSDLTGPGWHGPEPAEQHRHTNGDAILPTALLDAADDELVLEIETTVAGHYRAPVPDEYPAYARA